MFHFSSISLLFVAVQFALLLLLSSSLLADARYVPSSIEPTSYGAKASLNWDKKKAATPPRTAYPDLEAEFMFWDDHTLRLRVQPQAGLIPKHLKPPYVIPGDIYKFNSSLEASRVKAAAKPRYSVAVRNETVVVSQTNAATGKREQLLDLGDLVFEEQLLRFSSDVSGDGYISGWSEVVYNYFRNSDLFDMDPNVAEVDGNNVSFTTWGGDWGTPAAQPLYAQAPYYFVAAPKTSTFYGVFVANSHAGNLYMTKKRRFGAPIKTFTRRGPAHRAVEDYYRLNVTFIGGVFDIFVITGDSMMDVLRRYHKLIGTAMVPPAYAIGYCQSRWGYLTLDHLKGVVANFSEHDLPLSLLSNDNDYNFPSELMWTLNEATYPEKPFRDFLLKELFPSQIQFIQIADPFLALRKDYWLWESAKNWSKTHADAVWFKKSPTDSSWVSATGWAGWSTFFDYSAPSTCEWWQQSLDGWRQRIPISASLLDMAEISAFGCGTSGYPACRIDNDTVPFPWNFFGPNNGSFNQKICIDIGRCYVPNNTLNHPPVNPYTIGKDWQYQQAGYEIYSHTVTMDAWSANDGYYYSFKSFYNLRQMRCTYDYYARALKTRPFLLVRATTPGAGSYASHWCGDNVACWSVEDGCWGSGVADWIQLALWANLHGVTTTGPDVGGFQGPKSSPELMTRWHGVASFATWYWQHRSNGISGDESYNYPRPARDAIRRAMFKRWQLLPIIFGELMRSHFEGGPTLRHPSLEFAHDAATYADHNSKNFMVGAGVLVLSVVVQGASSVTSYLPAGSSWYSLWSWRCVSRYGGESKTLSAVLYKDDQPALLRGGIAHPMHTFVTRKLQDTRATGISVVCALDARTLTAHGEAWFDDGKDSLLPDSVPAGRNNASHPVRRVRYSCGVSRAATTSVFFEASVVDEGSPSPQPMPLAARNATITFLFPDAASVVDPHVLGLDGATFSRFTWSRSLTGWQPPNITNKSSSSSSNNKTDSNVVSITLPSNKIDGTTSFRLEYAAKKLPVYPSSGSASGNTSHHHNSHPGDGNSDTDKINRGLVAGLAVLGALLLGTIIYIAHKRHNDARVAVDAGSPTGESTNLLNN